MIFYYITLIVLGALQAVVFPISLLPDVSFPATLNTAIGQSGNYIGIFNAVLPKSVPTIFAIFTIYISIEFGIWTYKLIKWIYSKIPGVN
jgi:hypothetical protein